MPEINMDQIRDQLSGFLGKQAFEKFAADLAGEAEDVVLALSEISKDMVEASTLGRQDLVEMLKHEIPAIFEKKRIQASLAARGAIVEWIDLAAGVIITVLKGVSA